MLQMSYYLNNKFYDHLVFKSPKIAYLFEKILKARGAINIKIIEVI